MNRPLVVWFAPIVCPRCDHDLYVTTDGTHLTITVGHLDNTITPERDGTLITFPCIQPNPDLYERCGNTLTVDLSREEWTADPRIIDYLMAEPYPVTVVS